MNRRIRIHRPDHNLQLTLHLGFLLRAPRRQRKRTDTFAVETHVLGKRLGERDLVSLGYEVADGKGIARGGAGGEALVGHVEEGEELPLLDHLGDRFPLLGGGVDACWIVCAGVQKDYAPLWSVLAQM